MVFKKKQSELDCFLCGESKRAIISEVFLI